MSATEFEQDGEGAARGFTGDAPSAPASRLAPHYPRTFSNFAGEDMPPFAVFVANGAQADRNGALKAEKTTESNRKGVAWLNGPHPVPFDGSLGSDSQHTSQATRNAGVYALYDSADGAPALGETWGKKPGQWTISKTGDPDFEIIGGADTFSYKGVTQHRVLVAPATSATVKVYRFEKCSDGSAGGFGSAPTTNPVLFIDNAACADHAPGGALDALPVAVLLIDGVYSCWTIQGAAESCKTGQCAEIVAWMPSCNGCLNSCFALVPCDGGGTTHIVQGAGWLPYLGKVIGLDEGAGVHNCYTVSIPDPGDCRPDAYEAISPDDILTRYEDCAACGGCYEMTPCEGGDPVWIRNALAKCITPAGTDPLGSIWAYQGVCYTVTDFEETCTHDEAVIWPDCPPCGGGYSGFGTTAQISCMRQVAECDSCCYRLTPCPGQAGDPPVRYVKQISTDTIDLWDFVEHEPVAVEGGGDMYPSNRRVLMLADFICYTVDKVETCDSPTSGLGTVRETYDPTDAEDDACPSCLITTWQECGTTNKIATYTDLGRFNEGPPGAYTTSRVLKRAEDEICYEFYGVGNLGGGSLVDFTVEDDFADCATCAAQTIKLSEACQDGCTEDANCTDAAPPAGADIVILKDDAPDLADAIGQYVSVNGKCYYVDWTTDEATTDSLDWCGPYKNCDACRSSEKILTVIVKKSDGTIGGVVIRGKFFVCGDATVTESCPAGANGYAAASIL